MLDNGLDLETVGWTRNFDRAKPLFQDFLPAFRERNFLEFLRVGLPTTRDEEFKYVPLRHLEATEYGLPYGATISRGDLAGLPLGNLDAITIAFVNGEYAPDLSSADSLPEGMIVGSVREMAEAGHPLLENLVGATAHLRNRLGSTNDERFVHLNGAFFSDGAFVYVPSGVVVERPIHILHVANVTHGLFSVHPRHVITLEENAQAKIVESYLGIQGAYFINPVAEIRLAEAANLEHVRFQRDSATATHIGAVYVHQEARSVYFSTNLQLGSETARLDLNAYVGGEHAETWLNGANVGRGAQVIDNHTRIDHALPNCQSFEIYKTVLKDKAQGVFNGKIFVYQDAQKTDAKQTNQALLLSDSAVMNSKPQLEIFADDVKCTHGATVGQLRPDALFYLRARGIPKAEAEALLVYAFAAEVIERVRIAEVREVLANLLFAQLSD